jgi:hypothetical protein
VAAHGGRVALLGSDTTGPGAPAHNPMSTGAHFRIELPHALAD